MKSKNASNTINNPTYYSSLSLLEERINNLLKYWEGKKSIDNRDFPLVEGILAQLKASSYGLKNSSYMTLNAKLVKQVVILEGVLAEDRNAEMNLQYDHVQHAFKGILGVLKDSKKSPKGKTVSKSS